MSLTFPRVTPPMPPRVNRAIVARPERRALQDAIAWPIVIALLAGALLVFFLPRFVPLPYVGLAVGAVLALVSIALIVVLSILVERWLRAHAITLAGSAEGQVQTVGLAGLPVATGGGALLPLASAYADAGARAALQAAERESGETLARLGANAATRLEHVATQVRAALDTGSPASRDTALASLHDAANALRQVTALVPTAVTSVDVVAEVRSVAAELPDGAVHVIIEADRGLVSIDRDSVRLQVRALLMLAHRAAPGGIVTLHVSRVFRSSIEETPVRRTGDSRLTIVPRNSGDSLRAWVTRAQPGAEVLSLVITDGGAAPSPEVQQRAFDPFAMERAGDPLGVTLASVRRAVQASRGTIWIDGSREGGAAVHLLLPITTS